MKRIVGALIACVLPGFGTSAAQVLPIDDPAHLRLRPVPHIALNRTIEASAVERERIQADIRALAEIDQPDFGLSPIVTGSSFAPVPSMGQASAGVLIAKPHRASESFTSLVQFGPKALPFLLAALQDRTPTRLVVRNELPMGAIEFARELHGNAANPTERKILHALPAGAASGRNSSSYTVTIGDVCFVIVGQIVGRSYLAVRYQPTAIVVINSPATDSAIADAVRRLWWSDNSAQHLLDSLLLDYASEGVFDGQGLDNWDLGSRLQCDAALRLLYYFPRETAPLIAARLKQLEVQGFGQAQNERHTPEDARKAMLRETRNGVRTVAFVKAVAWSGEPEIRAALAEIFRITTDADLIKMRSESTP